MENLRGCCDKPAGAARIQGIFAKRPHPAGGGQDRDKTGPSQRQKPQKGLAIQQN
jgi:hypothetical protein